MMRNREATTRPALAAFPQGRGRGRRAFTLFEVMAAVAILVIWYLILAAMAMQGLRAEGESRRRMEASLLADNVLAGLEASALGGSAPEPQKEKREENGYEISLVVAPLRGGSAGKAADEAASDEAEEQPIGSLIGLMGKEMPGMVQHLRVITVRVRWQEGGRKRRVLRTSFAFDALAAAEIYQEGAEEEELSVLERFRSRQRGGGN